MKTIISNILRKLWILSYVDKIRYYLHFFIKFKDSREFKRENPQIKLPPSYLIYESFNLNYHNYYYGGKESAIWLLEHLKKYKELRNVNILDWGCGPARIIRHLPELLDSSCSIYGCDYNSKSIIWNKNHISKINFSLNSINPPLSYVDNSFDVIYGISIFTHLTEELHYKWFDELVRVSRNNSVILLTLAGEVFKFKLTQEEAKIFNSGQILAKGNTKIGHRTYTTYHPETFAQKLFSNYQILEHIKGEMKNGKPQQDIWIIKVVK